MKNIYFISVLCVAIMSCNEKKEFTQEDLQAVLTELEEIRTIDQQYAGLPPKELTEKYDRKEAWRIFGLQKDSVNQINQQRIKGLYEKYGYLDTDLIGDDGATSFWLPIQHADNDVAFQQQMLVALKDVMDTSRTDLYHFAMLEDRVNVNQEKPQRFGSQVTYNNFGQAVPKFGLQDTAQVERLRREYGLPPFREYYNRMTLMHFEMNRQRFLDIGITEPKLYE